MLITGILVGAVLATAVGVGLLGMRLSTVGDAEAVIEAPTETVTHEPETTQTATSNNANVPDPCVASAEYNITIDEQIDELALGARDEDARTIQEALDAIQGAREDADGAAQECLDLAGQPSP